MDTYIILHGFGSSPSTSKTVNTLSDMIKEYQPDANIMAPHYDGSKPVETAKMLLELSKQVSGELTILGCSLGGFWANWLASNTVGAKLILINPALKPSESLDKTIKDGLIQYQECQEYKKYEGFAHNDMTLAILARNDDVVPYQYAYDILSDKAKVVFSESGGHRMNDLMDFKKTIFEFLNTYVN